MFNLTPKNDRFYDYFDRSAALMVRVADEFLSFLDAFEKPQEFAAKIKDLEHEADVCAHETMELLHRSFITPIERSDIRRLVNALDDVADFVDDAVSRIALYEV